MNDNQTRAAKAFVSFGLLVFFLAISMVLWFGVFNISDGNSFFVNIVFWVLDWLILLFFFTGRPFVMPSLSLGMLPAILMITIVYSLIEWILVIAMSNASAVAALLIQLVLLFAYFLVISPMIVIGLKKD
jgi:hypothetical protein